jgi:hypothetical protein
MSDALSGAVGDLVSAIEQDDPGGLYHVVAGIGGTRAEALGSEGRDGRIGIEPGDDPSTAILAFAEARLRAHDQAPRALLYLVLRRSGRQGNVAVSRPIPIGTRTVEGELSGIRGRAESIIFESHNKIVEDYGRWSNMALQLAFSALKAERDTAIDFEGLAATVEAEARAGSSGTQAALIEALRPVIAGVAGKVAGGGQPVTPETVVSTFNAWDDATKLALIEALRAAEQASPEGAA